MFGRQQILADFGGLLTGVLADLANRVVDLGEHLAVHVRSLRQYGGFHASIRQTHRNSLQELFCLRKPSR